jgi:hypothetical protein
MLRAIRRRNVWTQSSETPYFQRVSFACVHGVCHGGGPAALNKRTLDAFGSRSLDLVRTLDSGLRPLNESRMGFTAWP